MPRRRRVTVPCRRARSPPLCMKYHRYTRFTDNESTKIAAVKLQSSHQPNEVNFDRRADKSKEREKLFPFFPQTVGNVPISRYERLGTFYRAFLHQWDQLVARTLWAMARRISSYTPKSLAFWIERNRELRFAIVPVGKIIHLLFSFYWEVEPQWRVKLEDFSWNLN